VILLVTNSRDLATDSVVELLRSRNAAYWRLDLDLLALDQVFLDPLQPLLTHVVADGEQREVRDPQAILYRAPTHLRESSGHRYSPEELLRRHQWAAFARSLIVFRRARWVNHPTSTYAAESKPFQLAVANSLGFQVPRTAVANYLPASLARAERVAVKALDSFLLRLGGEDLFFYTTTLLPDQLTEAFCREMPLILQENVEPKTDIRVTVVGERCFFAETIEPVIGDWRLRKERVEFRPFAGTPELKASCLALLRHLDLRYGAIDLARVRDDYLFFEVNPTGEWGWLDVVFEGRIAEAIVDELLLGGTFETR